MCYENTKLANTAKVCFLHVFALATLTFISFSYAENHEPEESPSSLEGDLVRDGAVLYRKPIKNIEEIQKNQKRLIIEHPFSFSYLPNTIEKASFDYAMVARTQNLPLLKTFYTEEGLKFREQRFGSIADKKYISNARFDKHFSINIRPHLLNPKDYHVEINYYLSEKQPKFSTIAVMTKLDGEWKIK